jgi:ABC-type ATPase with predicted acetyltransferase domain
MGQIARYECKNCGNWFKADVGGGMSFLQYRCVECDTIKNVDSDRTVPIDEYKPPTKIQIGICNKCGGELREHLKPMCDKCKSRDVEEKEVIMFYD